MTNTKQAFLICRPFGGFSVVTKDEWGNVLTVVGYQHTASEAIKAAAEVLDRPLAIPLEVAP